MVNMSRMKDTITIKISVEADFSTLQDLRSAFADEQVLDLLKREAQAVIQNRLKTETDGSVQLEIDIKMPAYKTAPKGSRTPIPQVKNDILTWFDPYTEHINTVDKVGSKAWFDWLKEPREKSFSYISKHGATVTCIKNKQGYWYAHKRLDGKLKRKYLGRAENLTPQKLDDVAFKLAQRELV